MNELVAVAVVVAAVSGQPLAPADREVARLHAHFAQLDRELAARDVSDLSPDQRHARATHIARLRAYAATGKFPKNIHHPGAYVPYFVDDSGTRCAMGFLIEQSGHGDFVARVNARLNYAYIAEIARDPELGPQLLDWLDAHGLSLAEAARIQPAYGPCGQPGCPEEDEEPTVPTSYKVASTVAIVGGLTSVALNTSLVQLGLSPSARGWIGVATGGVAMTLGFAAPKDYGTIRMVTGGVGMLAAGLGMIAVLGPAVPTTTAESRLTGSPWVAPDGRSGVLLSLSF